MHKYRTHTCGELSASNIGEKVKLSGWIHRKRDHGNLLFIDLRDHYGLTQLVFSTEGDLIEQATHIKSETVLTVIGKIVERTKETINKSLPTGEIEVVVEELSVESECEYLPLQVNSDQDTNEELRLKYRYLDLRREKIHANIILRSKIIDCIRRKMQSLDFLELQTPILTASSPEGARDFLVPCRLHPGKFYALPQAPQIFKQLTMMSGFDKYFQIAPCFRDEDSRADRSPGEFYQLDVEMSFATQEDVFNVIEPCMHEIFTKFSSKKVSSMPFPRIKFADAMLKYGTDKPDLRNPLIISDVTEIFADSEFSIFVKNIKEGAIVRAIPAPKTSDKPRSFFDKMIKFAQEQGASGLAYIIFTEEGAKGPIAKFLTAEKLTQLKKQALLENGDAVFFSCNIANEAASLAGLVRDQLGKELSLIDETKFEFCWVTDFPYFELDKDTNKLIFSHNPFSMPQGGIKVLNEAKTIEDYLNIIAYQYDIVCNGVELSSGAIRNHKLDILYKAFEIVGYSKEYVNSQFSSLTNALKYGSPPHGGCAPGIDRIVMLLAEEPNIREVIMFPMNQRGEDLMMGAPSAVENKQLKELHIKLDLPKKTK
ncbi:MAG: aspartate--tRNA ligase [Rickettsiales bacterium]|nr:aspartate--tRNA ligase [Rickettsiales bacterium]